MDINANHVEHALEHLWDFSQLGAHPFAEMLLKPPRGVRNRPALMERGAALNQHLVAAIEQVRIRHQNPGKSRERRYHSILARCFVEGQTNREVARALDISERTFYRERLRAIDVLTRVLADGACNSQ